MPPPPIRFSTWYWPMLSNGLSQDSVEGFCPPECVRGSDRSGLENVPLILRSAAPESGLDSSGFDAPGGADRMRASGGGGGGRPESALGAGGFESEPELGAAALCEPLARGVIAGVALGAGL